MYGCTGNIKMENNELKKFCTCYYFDDIINLEDLEFDNILLDEKQSENIWVYDISYKILIGAKLRCIRFNKIEGFIRVYDATRYLVLFEPENVIPFTTGLNIL